MPLSNPDMNDSSTKSVSPTASSSHDLSATYDHQGEKSASNIVNWDGENDELNPLNWKPGKKWRNLGVVCMMTVITYVQILKRKHGWLSTKSVLYRPLASSMFAPGVPQAMEEFHSTSDFLSTFVVSIYVLGFAVGPLVMAPLSEIYGRQPAYIISNLFFVIFTVACAVSSNLGMLVAFRFLAGCAGGTPTTIGGATVADMFQKEKRGAAMAMWGLGNQLGVIIGPIIGGFLSQAEGWRWVFRLQAIIGGVSLLLGILWLQETYAVVILERKTRKAICETRNTKLVSALHDGIAPGERLRRAIIRPAKLLIFSPIVLLLSIYTAVVFGYLYLFVTTFPTVFQQQYGFGIGLTGLTYLGLGVGTVSGLVITGKMMDPLHRRLAAKNHGESKPEHRLPPLMFSAPLIGLSFFWYGWSAEVRTHWTVPIVGTVFFGMGLIPAFVSYLCHRSATASQGSLFGSFTDSGQISINMYLVDTYTRYAASAIAATKCLQSVAGAFLPLAGRPLYDSLGLGWGNSLLGFIAFAFVPVPWLFYRYGEVLRARCAVKL
jgi:multidrug resistance protein